MLTRLALLCIAWLGLAGFATAAEIAAPKGREVHPLKQWKLSPVDLASLDKWEDYTRAKEAMFFDTDTADADRKSVV